MGELGGSDDRVTWCVSPIMAPSSGLWVSRWWRRLVPWVECKEVPVEGRSGHSRPMAILVVWFEVDNVQQ